MKFRENVPLAKYSHYKIGGPARYFFEAKNEREITRAVAEAKRRKLRVFVLAAGTNLLISDKGFDGLVLRPMITTLRIAGARKGTVEVGAGVMVADLLKFTTAKALSGLEWAGGLPGTVGGAIRGNAGCFGGETKDRVVLVRSFDMRTMKFVTRRAAQCAFRYRDSLFKRKDARSRAGEIIVSATFRLERGDKRAIARAIREKIAYRAKHQPLEHPNIGSIFKNVPLHSLHAKTSLQYRIALAAKELSLRGSRFSVKTDPFPVVATAKFISEAGLRGVSTGGAMISPKHPNFIVNSLAAEADDVANLIALAKAEVRRRFGVRLEEEIEVV